jgi:hypothetical protein
MRELGARGLIDFDHQQLTRATNAAGAVGVLLRLLLACRDQVLDGLER